MGIGVGQFERLAAQLQRGRIARQGFGRRQRCVPLMRSPTKRWRLSICCPAYSDWVAAVRASAMTSAPLPAK